MNNYDWQHIETAPKDGTEILGYCSYNEEIRVVAWFEYTKLNGQKLSYWEKIDSESETTATHWMPLPKPPTN